MPEDSSDQPQSNGTEVKSNAEPSELDPCMEEDAKIKRKSPVFYRYRDELSDRTGLSHKGLYIVGGIVLAAFLLLIVVIALAAAWPTLPHRFRFTICKRPECLRAAAQIREGLNESASPCKDLWSATCGGWLKKNPFPRDRSIWNQKQQLVRKEVERIRDLIATLKLPLHTGTVEWKLKHLYESCMNVENVNIDGAGPLRNIITELGGWYILRDWNEEDFDKNILLEKLHVRYGVTPFFKISVEPNPNMPGHNSIRISPSGLGLPDKEYYYMDEDDRIQVAYKEYIRDVIMYLSTARNEATKFGTDIFSYEKRIAEVTPNIISLQNPIKTYNAISISELKQLYLIPFYDIIQAMYPDSNITDNTEVLVTSSDYLGHVEQIMATTDRKTMNGYLIWTLVRQYIPYLSNTYTVAMDTFNSELFGIQEPLERWEMCAGLVKKFMGLATNNYMEKINPISVSTIKIVNDTFNSIVNIVKSRINKFEDAALLYKYLNLKLSTLSLQIGVPSKAKDINFLKNYYLKLKIIKSDLFLSVKNGIIFQKNIEERRLSQLPAEEMLVYHILTDIPKVRYSASDHIVIVPRSLLTEPFFEPNFPSSIIYGRLGVEIAEAVVSSILPYDSLWTADRKILSPFHMTVQESIKTVQSATKCLSDYILNLNLAIPYATANETALKTLKHMSAVSVANEALISSLTEHVHQPSLENYEDSALFFLSYAQTQCSESTNQNQLYENMVHLDLPQRSILHLAWAQLPEFSESLQCSYNKNVHCRDIF